MIGEGECGHACARVEPYGFVPEAGCPVHDPKGGLRELPVTPCENCGHAWAPDLPAGYLLLSPEQVAQVREKRDSAAELLSAPVFSTSRFANGAVAAYDFVLALLDAAKEEKG